MAERGHKIVRASNSAVYPGVRLDRTLIVTDDYILDTFRTISDEVHTYDYAMHLSGALAQPGTGRRVRLGNARGYKLLTDIKQLAIHAPVTTIPCSVAGGAWEAALYAPGGTAIFSAHDPVPAKPMFNEYEVRAPLTCLVARRRARQTVFITCWSPSSASQRCRLTVTAADPAGIVSLAVGNTKTGTQRWRLPFVPAATLECTGSR